jgi:hypothetical protein
MLGEDPSIELHADFSLLGDDEPDQMICHQKPHL